MNFNDYFYVAEVLASGLAWICLLYAVAGMTVASSMRGWIREEYFRLTKLFIIAGIYGYVISSYLYCLRRGMYQ